MRIVFGGQSALFVFQCVLLQLSSRHDSQAALLYPIGFLLSHWLVPDLQPDVQTSTSFSPLTDASTSRVIQAAGLL